MSNNRTISGLKFKESLIFERSVNGRKGYSFKEVLSHGINPEDIFDEQFVRKEIEDFPELSEPDVLRHFTRLSQWNYCIENGIYPLGSCTMKYNPKINEDIARLEGFTQIHPYFPSEYIQGALGLLYDLQIDLKEITGFSGVTLQPSAGAHAELTGLKIMRAALNHRGDENKTILLIPDSAHGTNPASAKLAGFKVKKIASSPEGFLLAETVQEVLDETIAGIMITNPNTLGIYEQELEEIISIIHKSGGLIYADGANMNALLGKVRPGDIGIDVMHLNLHKTFSTPHGGGGPGSGPLLVSQELKKFLPEPIIEQDEMGTFYFKENISDSIGRMRSFYGNFLVNVRAYTYIRELGGKGLTQVTEAAVLGANYIRASLKDILEIPFPADSLHEVVFSEKTLTDRGIKTVDLVKRMIDYGIHPPTIYFPLIVKGAMMIEPTETESKDEIDALINAIKAILKEAEEDPDRFQYAPELTVRSRLDEVNAAKHPVLRWVAPQPESD